MTTNVPKLLSTNFLVLPCRRAEFKKSQLPGNGKIKFYGKDCTNQSLQFWQRKILSKLRVFPFTLNKDLMIKTCVEYSMKEHS